MARKGSKSKGSKSKDSKSSKMDYPLVVKSVQSEMSAWNITEWKCRGREINRLSAGRPKIELKKGVPRNSERAMAVIQDRVRGWEKDWAVARNISATPKPKQRNLPETTEQSAAKARKKRRRKGLNGLFVCLLFVLSLCHESEWLCVQTTIRSCQMLCEQTRTKEHSAQRVMSLSCFGIGLKCK